MAYPKPLSQKTIDRMYRESGLTDEQIAFIGNLFDSAAALYGLITLSDLWSVYKEYAGRIPAVRIHRKDLAVFSSIARREEHDYYIYEIDEIYSDEPRSDMQRLVVLREIPDLLSKNAIYAIEDQSMGKDFYIPDNLLSLKGHVVTEAEKRLSDFIGNLRADAPELTSRWKKESFPSPHLGKKLKDFSYLNEAEKYVLDWYSGKIEGGPKKVQTSKVNALLRNNSGTMAERFFRDLRIDVFCGLFSFTKDINAQIERLESVGVRLSANECKRFLSLLMEFNNSSHLYTNHGWAPSEMHSNSMRDYNGPLRLSFGPGIQKAIAEGKYSIDEFKARLEEMGIDVSMD